MTNKNRVSKNSNKFHNEDKGEFVKTFFSTELNMLGKKKNSPDKYLAFYFIIFF